MKLILKPNLIELANILDEHEIVYNKIIISLLVKAFQNFSDL